MTRLIDEPITVHINSDAMPDAFIWRRRLYRITEVLRWWRVPGAWGNGGSIRLFIRVTAVHRTAGNYELRRNDGQWYLHVVLD